ncbi:MAG: aminotransferase class IV [Cyanobacteria bacterium P01_D01_bin.56]
MTYWLAGQLYEGDQVTIAINNPALSYGASVFTTMRVYGHSLEHPLTAWQLHCDRITHSLNAFNWPQPNWEDIIQGCQSLLRDYPVLRIAILANGNELITGRLLPENLNQQQQQGVSLWGANGNQYQRSLPEHKTGNYLPCWLAMQAAKHHGARDAILMSSAGEWLETSTGNLWGYQNGQWFTPPLSAGILPGICRTQLLQTLDTQAVNSQTWTLDIARQFEALAYSNCVVGIMPVHTVLLGNIKLNYRSTHKSLNILRYMFYGPFMDNHSCKAE